MHRIETTRALDGVRDDAWGPYEATWTFHGDDGLQVTMCSAIVTRRIAIWKLVCTVAAMAVIAALPTGGALASSLPADPERSFHEWLDKNYGLWFNMRYDDPCSVSDGVATCDVTAADQVSLETEHVVATSPTPFTEWM
jgi:hypothetical protein